MSGIEQPIPFRHGAYLLQSKALPDRSSLSSAWWTGHYTFEDALVMAQANRNAQFTDAKCGDLLYSSYQAQGTYEIIEELMD